MGASCSLLNHHPAPIENEVTVTFGEKVETHVTRRMIIFVFGGPGSCKGRIVSDLHQGFGLQVIDVESVILHNYYRNRAAKNAENSDLGDDGSKSQIRSEFSDMKDLMEKSDCSEKKDVSEKESVVTEKDEGDKKDTKSEKETQNLETSKELNLSLEGLLDIVQREIRNGSSEAGFLVDLIPNLRGAEKVLSRANVRQAMSRFEKDWPIAFALNLYGKYIHSHQNEEVLMGMKKDGASDEKDATRIRKRCIAYAACVQPLLQYFQDRAVRVQHDGINYQSLWDTVADLFWDLGFKTRGPVATTVYFLLDKNEALKLPQYKKQSKLPRVPPILPNCLKARDVFDGVHAQISKQPSPHRMKFVAHLYPFLQIMQWDSVSDKESRISSTASSKIIKQRQPIFHLPCPDSPRGADRVHLGTTNGDVCVFSKTTEMAQCRKITVHYASARQSHLR